GVAGGVAHRVWPIVDDAVHRAEYAVGQLGVPPIVDLKRFGAEWALGQSQFARSALIVLIAAPRRLEAVRIEGIRIRPVAGIPTGGRVRVEDQAIAFAHEALLDRH